MKSERRFFDCMVIVTFLVALVLPLVLTNNRKESLVEKRQLAPLPIWTWEKESIIKFPEKFQAWFFDHFGFRDALAKLYYRLGIISGASLSPQVIIGKQQWLFYADQTSGALEGYRKNVSLEPRQLRQWKSALEAKYLWLKRRGIRYVFVIAPDKDTIYGEYLPSRIRSVGDQSRLDQLMAYMKDSEVPILDLRDPLRRAKSSGQLYHKNDTHWNNFGAAVAQYEILKYLSGMYPNIHPVTYSKDDFIWEPKKEGDLAATLNLSEVLDEKSSPVLRVPLPEYEREIMEKNTDSPLKNVFRTSGLTDGPSILIFRDSFFETLWPYMLQHFSKSICAWEYPDMKRFEELVERHSPAIVLEERVERSLAELPICPLPSSEIGLLYFGKDFGTCKVIYQLTDNFNKEITELHQVGFESSEGGFRLASKGNDPYFSLPSIDMDKTKQYVIQVELSAPQKTQWRIFFCTSHMRGYDETHSFSGQLQPGENKFYAVLDGKDLDGKTRIRLDPGEVAGEYLLRTIEIQAVDRQ